MRILAELGLLGVAIFSGNAVWFVFDSLLRYEWIKRILREDAAHNTSFDHMLSAMLAGVNRLFTLMSGAWTLTLTNPIWVVKTRMCLQVFQLPDSYFILLLTHWIMAWAPRFCASHSFSAYRKGRPDVPAPFNYRGLARV